MMKSKEFIKRLKDIVDNHNTVYALGMFGQPITESIIAQKTQQLPSWYNLTRQNQLRNLIGKRYFGFDCVCLIKGILWGWNGDITQTNGGAAYQSNDVPDINDSQMLNKCIDVSTDFTNIIPGEYVWMQGHCGIYIGNGVVVEATPKWYNKVQYTNLGNIPKYKIGNYRLWTKHGKLPYVDYSDAVTPSVQTTGVTIQLDMLQKGSRGSQVKALQTLLIGYGYSCGVYGADGDFGAATDAAVKVYQRANGLAVDGIVGKDTWNKLLK